MVGKQRKRITFTGVVKNFASNIYTAAFFGLDYLSSSSVLYPILKFP